MSKRKKTTTQTIGAHKKKQPPSLIRSLPNDVIIDILARVPRCDYPTLSLVSKYFQSLVFSPELYKRRSLLGFTKETETPKKDCGFSVPEAVGYNLGNNYQTIYVKGFDTSLARVDIKIILRKHFGSCGQIIRVFDPIECETGARLGFAFINMKDKNDIEKVLTLNGSELGGNKLEVMMAEDRNDFYSYPYPNSKGCDTCRVRDHRMRIYKFNSLTCGGRLMSMEYLRRLKERTWPNIYS